MRFDIVKQSDVSFGTALHYALDWTCGHKALCGKTMRSTVRFEVGYKRRCGSCVRIMAKLVEKAHAEALRGLTFVAGDTVQYTGTGAEDDLTAVGVVESVDGDKLMVRWDDGDMDEMYAGRLVHFIRGDCRIEAMHAEALEVAKDRLDVADFDEEAVYAQAKTTTEENKKMSTPLYVRITEGTEDQENASIVVAENETFQFGTLGWSGGLRHVDLYRASGERVRFDLEYFKKVAVAVDHINFQPQPRGLEDPMLRRAFVQAGKSEVERLREERDAFKSKLMESFVYMTLAADKIETTSISRSDFAKEIRQFVRDGHRLSTVTAV